VILTLILGLSLIQAAYATIDIADALKDSYSLGEELSVSLSITEDKDIENAVIGLTLSCLDYNLAYFVTLLDVKAEDVNAIAVPTLRFSKSMKGQCSLKARLETVDGERISTFNSDIFDVEGSLPINIHLSNYDFLPSDDIDISFALGEDYDMDYLLLTMVLDTTQYHLNSTQSDFVYSIDINDDISSGEHSLLVMAADPYGNEAESSFIINIAAVAKRMGLSLGVEQIYPGDNITIKPILYDQSDEEINNKDILVEFYNSDGEQLLSKTVPSGQDTTYGILQFAVPGEYGVKLSYNELRIEKSVFVNEVLEIDVQLRDNLVHIENTGNVRYDEEVDISLKGDGREYVVTKRVRLDPAEELEVDISKEVPEGVYDVVVSLSEGSEALSTNAGVEDNRPFLRKFSQGLATITGASTVDREISNKSFLFFVLFSLITILIVVFTLRVLSRRRKGKPVMDLGKVIQIEDVTKEIIPEK